MTASVMSAPFDHSQIKVPHGAVGDENSVKSGNSLGSAFAEDDILIIPAVGANGRQDPLQPFDSFLTQDQAGLNSTLKSKAAGFFLSRKRKGTKFNENDEF